jgi:hypothetical protein
MLLTWRKQERAIVRAEHMKHATRAISHFRKIQRFELISGQKFEKRVRHKYMYSNDKNRFWGHEKWHATESKSHAPKREIAM